MRTSQATVSLWVSRTPGSGPGPRVQATHPTVPSAVLNLKIRAKYRRAGGGLPGLLLDVQSLRGSFPVLCPSLPRGGAPGCLRMCSALGQDCYPPQGLLSGPAAPQRPLCLRARAMNMSMQFTHNIPDPIIKCLENTRSPDSSRPITTES